MSWQMLVVISVLSGSTSTILQRELLKGEKLNPVSGAILFQLFNASLAFIYCLFFGLNLDYGQLPFANIMLMIALYTIGCVAMYRSLNIIGAAKFALIFSTQIIWSVIIALMFLGESMTLVQLVGSLIIFAAVITTFRVKAKQKLNIGMVYGLVSAMTFGIAFANDGYILKGGFDAPSYLIIGFGLPALAMMAIYPKATKEMRQILVSKELLYKSMGISLLYVLTAITAYLAFQKGDNVAVIASVRQVQTILVVLGGLFILKERKHIYRTVVATIICFVGLLMVII